MSRLEVKGLHAHTLTQREQAILYGLPTVEADKSKLKWRKVKKWRLTQSKKELKPKARHHPGTHDARELLRQADIPLNVCQECGLIDHKQTVHHVDGNPYNNSLDNLRVLCKYCHGSYHNVVGMKGVKAWYWGTIPDY